MNERWYFSSLHFSATVSNGIEQSTCLHIRNEWRTMQMFVCENENSGGNQMPGLSKKKMGWILCRNCIIQNRRIIIASNRPEFKQKRYCFRRMSVDSEEIAIKLYNERIIISGICKILSNKIFLFGQTFRIVSFFYFICVCVFFFFLLGVCLVCVCMCECELFVRWKNGMGCVIGRLHFVQLQGKKIVHVLEYCLSLTG